MTKPARLNGLRHDEVPILPILPGFPGSVMAIVSLLTSAAKLSLVTESAGGAKRLRRQHRALGGRLRQPLCEPHGYAEAGRRHAIPATGLSCRPAANSALKRCAATLTFVVSGAV